MALVVGVDRGFITREQGLERLTQILDFLEKAPRYHGVWSHFLNGSTAQSMLVFGMFDNTCGDLVETSFLMEGLLAARQYFKGDSEAEQSIYQRITTSGKPWMGWYRRTSQNNALLWHWSPQWSWFIDHRLTGFNETMITYLLAIASPTHGVPASLYYTPVWADSRRRQSPIAADGRVERQETLSKRAHFIMESSST